MIETLSEIIQPVVFQELLFYKIRAFERYPDLVHAIFTRKGGASPPPYDSLNLSTSTGDAPGLVEKNFQKACRAVGVRPEQTASCRQIHSAAVFVVDHDNQRRVMGRGDGLVTGGPDIYLFMRFADCTPLLFYDPVGQIVGSAHAGWRGTVQNAAGATVQTMVEKLGCRPENIIAVIGPAIGPCCYEVGPEVIAAVQESFGDVTGLFGPDHRTGHVRHAHFDLWEANRRQLVAAGLKQIIQTRLCPACHTDEFFSHRADTGGAGRFGTLIGLRGSSE